MVVSDVPGVVTGDTASPDVGAHASAYLNPDHITPDLADGIFEGPDGVGESPDTTTGGEATGEDYTTDMYPQEYYSAHILEPGNNPWGLLHTDLTNDSVLAEVLSDAGVQLGEDSRQQFIDAVFRTLEGPGGEEFKQALFSDGKVFPWTSIPPGTTLDYGALFGNEKFMEAFGETIQKHELTYLMPKLEAAGGVGQVLGEITKAFKTS